MKDSLAAYSAVRANRGAMSTPSGRHERAHRKASVTSIPPMAEAFL